MKVVCLLSGGLDSSTLVASLVKEGNSVRAVSVMYGQKHSRELSAAKEIAEYYGVGWESVTLPGSLMAGSALTGKGEVPEGHYADPTMKATVVPARNLVLLSLATAVAVREGYSAVAYGPHAGDHAIYPDCRSNFVSAMEDVMARCDYSPVSLLTPFLGRDKSGIVKLGQQLGVPFAKTWSCYKGGEKHCGKCSTCYERKEAFTNAGGHDPTEYSD